jgi:hypothetical protein
MINFQFIKTACNCVSSTAPVRRGVILTSIYRQIYNFLDQSAMACLNMKKEGGKNGK